MADPAWKVGEYLCCNGSITCANNRLRKQVDEFIASVKPDEDKARGDLWTWIANLEEDIEFLQFKLNRRRHV